MATGVVVEGANLSYSNPTVLLRPMGEIRQMENNAKGEIKKVPAVKAETADEALNDRPFKRSKNGDFVIESSNTRKMNSKKSRKQLNHFTWTGNNTKGTSTGVWYARDPDY
eukprot:CAMPEP_0116040234 /NCGR_PEP_ID=MMETSP0321-20121206/24226_1 /TAXON_ID=163516 /ORGANISM="Leptocylindrus danicus var. danicus, Strain B650" /LENGTH=110 /DNA_ID=CAMNT_0003519987 /DNA_START=209 /DNA_END=541 /DNA_ORIENTATION=+